MHKHYEYVVCKAVPVRIWFLVLSLPLARLGLHWSRSWSSNFDLIYCPVTTLNRYILRASNFSPIGRLVSAVALFTPGYPIIVVLKESVATCCRFYGPAVSVRMALTLFLPGSLLSIIWLMPTSSVLCPATPPIAAISAPPTAWCHGGKLPLARSQGLSPLDDLWQFLKHYWLLTALCAVWTARCSSLPSPFLSSLHKSMLCFRFSNNFSC